MPKYSDEKNQIGVAMAAHAQAKGSREVTQNLHKVAVRLGVKDYFEIACSFLNVDLDLACSFVDEEVWHKEYRSLALTFFLEGSQLWP